MITLGEIAEWILKNRRKTAFINYTRETILDELVRCANEATMICITDEADNIVGIATAKTTVDKECLHIYNILTTKPGIVKKMLIWFKTNYPHHTIEGKARGIRHRKFTNLDKLINKL